MRASGEATVCRMTTGRSLHFVWIVWLGLSISHTAWAQTIEITSLPPYAVDGSIAGVVTGVDPATHRVAVYIQIEGAGWWTKPSFAMPSVPIALDGSFSADVATGGLDNRATIYCAALIAASDDPPQAAGAGRMPSGLQSLAVDCDERYGRIIQFAGHDWAVKEAPLAAGPGSNLFSDRVEDVFVDPQGRLHLAVDYHDGAWWAVEVILLDRLGYGTYLIQTESELDDLDRSLAFGAFTWDPYGDEEGVPGDIHREIDFEDSRWGNAAEPSNAQMVVQPYTAPHNLRRYTLPDLGVAPELTRFFSWSPNQIEFVALTGHRDHDDYAPADVIDSYVYTHAPASSRYVPSAGRAAFRINLWPNNVAIGGPGPPQPAGGQRVEVVVTHFVPEPDLSMGMTAGSLLLGLLARRRRP
jgi:hypothetical protein